MHFIWVQLSPFLSMEIGTVVFGLSYRHGSIKFILVWHSNVGPSIILSTLDAIIRLKGVVFSSWNDYSARWWDQNYSHSSCFEHCTIHFSYFTIFHCRNWYNIFACQWKWFLLQVVLTARASRTAMVHRTDTMMSTKKLDENCPKNNGNNHRRI